MKWVLAASAVLALGVSAPAFAASSPVTLLYVSAETPATVSGENQVTVKVSGLTAGSLVDLNLFTSSGHKLGSATQNTVTTNWYDGQTGTEVFTFTLPASDPRFGPITSVSIFEILRSGKEATGSYTSNVVQLDALPYGQLPEVPWAAALPLAGLGLGGLVWMRRNRSESKTHLA